MRNPDERMGSQRDAAELKEHPFLADMNWYVSMSFFFLLCKIMSEASLPQKNLCSLNVDCPLFIFLMHTFCPSYFRCSFAGTPC